MMIFIVVMMILFYRTPNVGSLKYLLPMLESGVIEPVVEGWRLITFPYGETVIFTMIYAHMKRPEKLKLSVYVAVIFQGIVLSMLNILFITGLGLHYAETQKFPLFDALRLIRITGFMDRLDILIIIVLVVDGFIKISFFMYVAVAGISQLFKIRNKSALSWPLGVVILVSSMLIARNFHQHIEIGLDFTPKYIHLPLQIGIPVMTLIVHYIRNGSKKKASA
jgi:spore germination protein KB